MCFQVFALKLLELSYVGSYFSECHSLAVKLGLHFFATCLLVYIIAVERADTVFSRLVMKI